MGYSKFEKFLYIFLILLAVFIAGVQIGIHHGRGLQKQEIYYLQGISGGNLL